MHSARCFLIALTVLMAGCTSSGLRHNTPEAALPMCKAPAAKSRPEPIRKVPTLFEHPGLLLAGIDWGRQRALIVGNGLVAKGYADRLVEVRSRDKKPMLEQMTADRGGDFVGIHYSMGGAPHVLQAALQAAEGATKATGVMTRYSALMVDPFALADIEKYVNPDNPHLKRVFIILSNRNQSFRPDPSGLSAQLKNNPKFHFIFPEEFGVHWDHFSFLTEVKGTPQLANLNSRRGHAIFNLVLQGLFGRMTSDGIENALYRLKVAYAVEDGRKVLPGLCRFQDRTRL